MEKNRWVRGLIEGIAALAFGIFILFSPDNATNLIGLAAAGFLLVAGVVEAIARRERYTDTGFIRGIIGLVGGVIMLFLVWGDFVSITTAFNIFAAFLIAYGGVGLFNDFFSRGGKAFEWGPVLLDLILLAWGVLIFFSRGRFSLLHTSGWVLVAIGVVIGAWALFVKRPRGTAAES